MKKIIALVVSMMLILTAALTGCGKKENPDASSGGNDNGKKPVINIYEDEMSVTTGYVVKYAYPEADCKSVVDRKRLDVVVTATAPDGKSARAENGFLYPETIGEYILHYNATDKNGAKADEVLFKVTFEDNGPVITSKEGTANLIKASTFEAYKIPEFNDILNFDYALKGLTNDDVVQVEKTATFTAIAKEPIVIDVTKATKYGVGFIDVTYVLAEKANNAKKYEYNLSIDVANPLADELTDRGGNASPTTVELSIDTAVSKDPFIKISTTFATEDLGWPGAKIVGPNSLFDALNEDEDNVLVLNCYNPTPYWGKYYFSAYDDKEYSGAAGYYARKYRVAPRSYFTMSVHKHTHKGEINIFELAIENCWGWTGEELPQDGYQEKPEVGISKGGWHANEFYILSTDIVKEAEISENVWENDNMPVLKAYKNQNQTNVESEYGEDVVVVSKTTAEDKVQGLKIATKDNKNKNGDPLDVYVDFLSDPAKAQFIKDNFANVRGERKYERTFSFKVHNPGTETVELWASLGTTYNMDHGDEPMNKEKGKENWLRKFTVKPGESRQIYYNADTRHDDCDNNEPFQVVRLCVPATGKTVIVNDVKIITMPVTEDNDKIPTTPFVITEKEVSEEAKVVAPEKKWTIPSGETFFETKGPSTMEVKSVSYLDNLESVPVVVDLSKDIIAKTGYYDVKYIIRETVSGDEYIRKVRFVAKDDFTALEKVIVDKVAVVGEHYNVPEFDSIYDVKAKHEMVGAPVVESRENDEDPWVKTEDFVNGYINVTGGQYKITYNYKETESERTGSVYYVVRTQTVEFDENTFSVSDGAQNEISYNGSSITYTDKVGKENLWVEHKELFNGFNGAKDNCVLVIKGRSLSDTDLYVEFGDGDMCNEFGEYDASIKNSLIIKANSEFTVLFSRNACTFSGSMIDIAIHSAGSIEIDGMYLAYEDNYTSSDIYASSKEHADAIVADNEGCVHAVEATTEGLKFTSANQYNWTYVNILTGKNNDENAMKAINTDGHNKAIAFEVTNNTKADASMTDCAIYMYCGNTNSGRDNDDSSKPGANNNYDRATDFNTIKAGETRTFYITRSMLNYVSNGSTADFTIDYLVLCLKGSDFTLSNVRVVDFSQAN